MPLPEIRQRRLWPRRERIREVLLVYNRTRRPEAPAAVSFSVIQAPKLRLTLGVPTLCRYDLLARMLTSAERGNRRPDRYIVVDNGGKLDELVRTGRLRVPRPNVILSPEENIGVAASWNLILERCASELALIVNDDVEFQPASIAAMERMANTRREYIVGSRNQHVWACFIQKPGLVETIGYYDENFWPAYQEDIDYIHRMKLRGLQWVNAPAIVAHQGGASTAVADDETRAKWKKFNRENQGYLQKKWGPNFDTPVAFGGSFPEGWKERPVRNRISEVREWTA